jgi:hypothetical protein
MDTTRKVEEIYQEALKLTSDEREILEILLRLDPPLPDGGNAEPGRASIDKKQPDS